MSESKFCINCKHHMVGLDKVMYCNNRLFSRLELVYGTWEVDTCEEHRKYPFDFMDGRCGVEAAGFES